jgi:hypothetical protein
MGLSIIPKTLNILTTSKYHFKTGLKLTALVQNSMAEIIRPDDIAALFGKSLKWVYKNAAELNGSKIGGSLFFTREGIANAIQRGQLLAWGGHNKAQKGSSKVVQIKTGCRKVGGRRAKATAEAANRHGLDNDLQ